MNVTSFFEKLDPNLYPTNSLIMAISLVIIVTLIITIYFFYKYIKKQKQQIANLEKKLNMLLSENQNKMKQSNELPQNESQTNIDVISDQITQLNTTVSNQEQIITNIQNNNQISLQTITDKINQLNSTISSQNQKISNLENEISRNVQSLKTENQNVMKRLQQIPQNQSQIKLQPITDKINQLNSTISSQNQKISNLENEIRRNVQSLKTENQNVMKKLQQNESKINEQQSKYATKFSVSGNQISLQNERGSSLSSVSVPSQIEKCNIGSNDGYIKLTNRLMIQWGRYTPASSNWVGDNVLVNFPVTFASTPFLTTTGGPGGSYHPGAENVSNKSFRTGYDHNQPTTWIAIGTI